MKSQQKSIVWFRQDLRKSDNPALAAAASNGEVIPVFILEDLQSGEAREIGGASKWWLHHSLAALRDDLGGLALFQGDASVILPELAKKTGASAVLWNRRYEPEAIARDSAIKTKLRDAGVEVQSHNGSLLHEPWELKTQSGGPFKVFTPYWRASSQLPVAEPLRAPKLKLDLPHNLGVSLDDLALLPSKPNWAKGWDKIWKPGEAGARSAFDKFVKKSLSTYGTDRDRPDREGTSQLSPHLHWGEISVRQIWSRLEHEVHEKKSHDGALKFMSELGWREFCHHLIYHFPDMPKANWRKEFDAYPWRDDREGLKAWQRGQTGYPLVDAGMRQLWQTGWMHNRVRMIVASFLIKHLRVDWRQGEEWFWDTLVDADLANNAAGWQWVAGSGADASPYFRIFNPIVQGQKFDPEGDYVRRWCPELAKLPAKYIHEPFAAPPDVLSDAGIKLGKTYPEPIVDHDRARKAALDGYKKLQAEKAS